MDNGQYGKTPVNQELFDDSITIGVGSESEHSNPLSSGENLNSDNFEDRDYNILGNTALNVSSLAAEEISDNSEHLGQIIDLMPPSREAGIHPADGDAHQPEPIAPDPHFTDGKTSPRDRAAIKAKVSELSQNGNIAGFYNYWQKARKNARKAAMEEAT